MADDGVKVTNVGPALFSKPQVNVQNCNMSGVNYHITLPPASSLQPLYMITYLHAKMVCVDIKRLC